jgi:predicted ATPase
VATKGWQVQKIAGRLPLLSVEVHRFKPWRDAFPYSVPLIRDLERIEFESPVTFLVGENGCGKSTLIEALACAANTVTVGSEGVGSDPTLVPLRELAKDLRLAWSRRNHRGFFMRAEDFFGYARRLAATRTELERDLEDVKRDYADRSPTAQAYARSGYEGQLGALQRRYGEGLETRSHGEGFLALFQSRFVPGGLYLLDEPEAPLSPLRQLSFLVLLDQMVRQDAQFIIATHSPILMAFPGATILSLDHGRIEKVAYNALEHVRITQEFLADPERYLRHLLAPDDE